MPVRRLIFYTKPGCSLCDAALPAMDRLAQRHGLLLTTIDIESDPALRARHGRRIPVVEFEGLELGWGRLSPDEVARGLAVALQSSRRRDV